MTALPAPDGDCEVKPVIWGAFVDRPADTIVNIAPTGMAVMGRPTESPHLLLMKFCTVRR